MALFGKQPDRRFELRRTVSSRGLVVGQNLELTCNIVDVSNGGVRVRLDRAVALPRVVTVVNIDTGTACEADVAWLKGQEAGLKCHVKATSLHGLVPTRFTAAREAWKRAGGR